jgi:hypothetical protein
VITVLGWLGAGALLAAYLLASAGRLDAARPAFQALNLVGAAGIIVNSGYYRAWPSVALNVVWLGIGAAALLRSRRAPARDTGSGPVRRPQAARTGD